MRQVHRLQPFGVILSALILPATAAASFVDIGAGLIPVALSSAAWADYDSDGDLDILLTGSNDGTPVTRLYRNDGGTFIYVPTALPGVKTGAVAWGDCDNDGDLDVLISGSAVSGLLTRVYRNDGGGTFTDLGGGFPGVGTSAVAWSDYDTDGRLDFVLAGNSAGGRVSLLYHNDGGGSFSNANAGLRGVTAPAVAWADFDADGDPDLLLTGEDTIFSHISRIYRNDGGSFADIGANLEQVNNCAVAWADPDADGDLDFVLSGHVMTGQLVFHFYRNDGVLGFFDAPVGVPGMFGTSCSWGDADNDGDVDVLVSGDNGSTSITRIYRNDGGNQFNDAAAGLPGVSTGTSAWGDYDNDGDLDILLTGAQPGGSPPLARIYRNDVEGETNAPPAPPSGLQMTALSDEIMFSWNAPTDDRTPTAALHYALSIGTTALDATIVGPHADLTNGFRRLPGLGNCGQRLSWSVPRAILEDGPFNWGVQAIDAGWRGSSFAFMGQVTSVPEHPGPARPDRMSSPRVVPNPFRSDTRIDYEMAVPGLVELLVLDTQGRLVRRLASGNTEAGSHTVRWDGRDAQGRAMPAGVYRLRLQSGADVRSVSMTLAR
jgi:hypothetical protein